MKEKIILIFIGIVLSVLTQVVATNIIPSNSVSYLNNKTSETTVTGALDELFSAVDINEQIAVIKEDITLLKNSSLTLDKAYPIGSIFISTSATNPGSIIGGTWVAYGTGKTLVGVDTNNNNFNTVDKTGGSSTVTLTTANLPSHTHSIPALSGTAANNGAHTHTLTATGSVKSTFTGSSATTSSVDINHTHDVVGTTGYQSANHTHSIPSLSGSTNSKGNHTHTPYLHSGYDGLNRTLNAGTAATAAVGTGISAVTIDGDTMWSGILSTNGAHSHTVSTTASTTGGNSANHYHEVAIKSAGMSANNTHTHTLTAKGSVSSTFTGSSATSSSNGAHTHTVSTTASTSGATGSGTAINIQNPYITVYMWKRTA